MPSNYSSRIFTKHNLVFMLLLLGVITLVSSYIVATSKQIDQISIRDTQKTQLIEDMSRIVRGRSLSMYAIYFQDDPFKQDDEQMKFSQLAVDFILKRDTFLSLKPSKDEMALFAGALRLIRISAPLQQDIVNQLISGQKKNILEYLVQRDLPLEEKIISIFDNLLSLQRKNTRNYLKHIHRENLIASTGFLVTLVLVFILSFVNSRRALIKIQRTESQLSQEKELAENTLATVTETIITTDVQGNIIGINNAGLAILNRPTSRILGKGISEVLPVLTCKDQTPVSIDCTQMQLDGPVCLLPKNMCMNTEYTRSVVEVTVFPIGNTLQDMKQLTYILRDNTYQYETESEITWAAEHDPLTHCYNRRGFERILRKVLNDSRQRERSHALFYIDLDRFKPINDQYGHEAGDMLLQKVAGIFQAKIRESDSLARIGGDEFCILLENCDAEKTTEIANELLEAIVNFRYEWKEASHSISASIGILPLGLEQKPLPISRLMNAADKACYLAKRLGGNRYKFTEPADI